MGLLNSYVNPSQEKKVEVILRKQGFSGGIVLSSEANHEFREYERFSTAVVNAVLSTVVSRYLFRLRTTMSKAGYTSQIYLMNSAGDMITIERATAFPGSITESGPAAEDKSAFSLSRNLSLPKS